MYHHKDSIEVVINTLPPYGFGEHHFIVNRNILVMGNEI